MKRVQLSGLLLCLACCLGQTNRAAAQNAPTMLWVEDCQPGTYKDSLAGWWRGNLEGYTDKASVKQGETISFKVSVWKGGTDITPGTYSIAFYRVGKSTTSDSLVGTLPSVTSSFQPLHDSNGAPIYPWQGGPNGPFPMEYRNGCDAYNWPVAFSKTIPSNWPSGFYYAQLAMSSLSGRIPFVVKEDNPGSTGNILCVIAWNTYQAYNYWGGGSLYWCTGLFQSPESNPNGEVIRTVSFKRPFGLHHHFPDTWCGPDHRYNFVDQLGQLHHRERDFINWAESNGYKVEYAVDLDVHNDDPALGLPLLNKYKLVVFPGHSEYWSRQERENVRIYRDGGGNLAFFAANNCYWKVDFQASDTKMYCAKDSTLWWWRYQPEGPESKIVGVLFGGLNVLAPGNGANSEQIVTNASHWIFSGTSLSNGSLFGYGDGNTNSCPDVNIDPVASGEADMRGTQNPPNTNVEVLARVYLRDLVSGEPHFGDQALLFNDELYSEVTYYEDNVGNARVFAAGGHEWAPCLFGTDATTMSTITKSILDHFSFKKYRGNIYATNLVWGNDALETSTTLDGDTYILPGKTLILTNNFLLTINSGVTLYVDGTLSITGNATITGGGTIVTRNSGVVNVSSNVTVTVPAGGSLNLGAGSTWKFSSGSNTKLKVNGSLTAIGTAGNPITFERNGTSGSWYGILIESSTAASNFDYCTSRNASYGIRIRTSSGNVTINHATLTSNSFGLQTENSSPYTIQNSTLQSNAYGIYVSAQGASGSIYIVSNTIIQNSSYGVYLYNGADPYVGYNTIDANCTSTAQAGVYCVTNSDPFMRSTAPGPDYGNNYIRNNFGDGVKAANNSYPILGIDYQQGTLKDYYGYNEVYGNSGFEINNYNTSGTIIAERNYWSANHDVAAPPSDLNGSVDYTPVLGGPPPGIAGKLPSANAIAQAIDFEAAFALEMQDQLQAAADLYLKLLASDPESDNVGFGVSGIIRCYKGLDRRSAIVTLLDDLSTKFSNTALSASAQDHSLPYLVNVGRVDDAIARATVLLQQNRNAADKEPDYLFRLASLYLHKSRGNAGSDLTNALGFYQELIQKYANSDFAFVAQIELEQLGVRGLAKPASEPASSVSSSDIVMLRPNYPNPFNPATEISYSIPSKGHVSLRIYYTTRGVEIRTLVNEVKESGRHYVAWDSRDQAGKAVASGVYLYRVTFTPEEAAEQSFTRNGKMSLLR